MKYDVDEQPLRHYQADGKLMMTLGEEKRFFLYTLKRDSLTYRDADKKFLEQFFSNSYPFLGRPFHVLNLDNIVCA